MSYVMDRLDTLLVNSPFKKLAQYYYEFRILNNFLKAEKIDLKYKVLLDAGCGAGHGLEIINKVFLPKKLCGFDVLPLEVELAKKVGAEVGAEVKLSNILETGYPSEKFDGIFVFEVLHHVPKWRDALKEINRILKPGGALLLIELNTFGVNFASKFFHLEHPKAANFEWHELGKGLNDAGFTIKRSQYGILYIIRGFGFFLCVKARQL